VVVKSLQIEDRRQCAFVVENRRHQGHGSWAGSMRAFETAEAALAYAEKNAVDDPVMVGGDFEEVRNITGPVIWRKEVTNLAEQSDRLAALDVRMASIETTLARLESRQRP
jgi:hypothetical protein